MAQTQGINRETVSGEALFILKNLKENGRLGRSNKLADVKALLEPSVSLEFDSYFFFLRKFHYIAMDREAQLKLTDQGERVVDGDALDKFADEVGEFFSDQIAVDISGSHILEDGDDEALPLPGGARPPPPPAEVLADSGLPLSLSSGSSRPGTATSRKAPSPPSTPSMVVEDSLLAGTPQTTTRSADALDVKPFSPAMPSPTPVPSAVPSVAPMASQATSGAASRTSDADVRYVKFDPIGSGPLGTVFKGRHNALGLDVCLKELKDIFSYFSFLQRGEVIKRLKKELCAQAQVRHPAVVAVLDQNTDISRPFVLELLRGSLREKLDQSGGKGLPVKNALRIFLQLCYGLRAAHSVGLNHHNLKPENVLFDPAGNAKISDFGLGRVIEVDQAKGMPQVFVGTGGMPYMSPELMSRQKDIGPPADVYGMGILFYEMVTGNIPGRRSPLPSEVNPDVPSKVDPIFDKMTADRREARYPDFEAVLTDFYGAFSDGEIMSKGDLVLWA